MKGSRAAIHSLVLTLLLVMIVGALSAPVQALSHAGGHGKHGQRIRPTPERRGEIDWAQRDRAVYVVSTLNAPLCADGHQLSTELWRNDDARLFDVLQSRNNSNLYFIEVRKANAVLLAVYAYEFGWRMPRGVQRSECVRLAPPDVIAAYRSGRLVHVARFHTTFPLNG
jgi:hypothetical protein